MLRTKLNISICITADEIFFFCVYGEHVYQYYVSTNFICFPFCDSHFYYKRIKGTFGFYDVIQQRTNLLQGATYRCNTCIPQG